MMINFPKGQLIPNNSTSKSKSYAHLLLKESPEALREQFLSLTTAREVAKLLDIEYRRLAYHIYIVSPAKRYKAFELPKKSGGNRQISTPQTRVSARKIKL